MILQVAQFLEYVNKQSKYYRSNNVILTMGGDFTYQYAEMYFKNLDKVIRYFVIHLNFYFFIITMLSKKKSSPTKMTREIQKLLSTSDFKNNFFYFMKNAWNLGTTIFEIYRRSSILIQNE